MARQPQGHGPDLAQALAGLLPPLLLEARISGGPLGDQLITQLGLSVQAAQNVDLTILARTSGTAFVIGIGSFMAYKLLCRMAKSDTLWTTLDQMVQQRSLPTANSPTSSPSKAVELTEGFYAVRLGGEHELLRKLDECMLTQDPQTCSKSPTHAGRMAVVQVRQGSSLRKLIRKNQRMQRAGIAACSETAEEMYRARSGSNRSILQRCEEQQRMRRRDEDEESVMSGLSDMTSASRIPPNPQAEHGAPTPIELPLDADVDDDDAASGSSTPVSASLQLQCDNELCWENEFSERGEAETEPEGLFLFRERRGGGGSLGSLSQLSAMQNLERMFRSMGAEPVDDGRPLVENALENLRDLDRLETNSSMTTGVARRCWLDSPKNAYKIADPKDAEPSEICSNIDDGQRCASRNTDDIPVPTKSQGLWELTPTAVVASRPSFEKYQNQQQQQQLLSPAGTNVMVDSVISSHSSLASTSALSMAQRQRTRRCTVPADPMFDSAIVSDEFCTQSNGGYDGEEEDDKWIQNLAPNEMPKE